MPSDPSGADDGADEGADAGPTFVDFFCGMGGMTQGFKASGWRPLAAVDVNPDMIACYAANNPDVDARVASVTDEDAMQAFVQKWAGRVAAVVGGPPCQGFSQLNHNTRSILNPNNSLPSTYARLAVRLRPDHIVMEEVPAVLNLDGGSVVRDVEAILGDAGYTVRKQVLNAADYGVPQKRKRLILVATLSGVPQPAFPPTPLPRRVPVAEAIDMPVDRAPEAPDQVRREITGQLREKVEARERLGAAYNKKFDSSYRVMDVSQPSRTLSSGYHYPGNGANTLKHVDADGTARYYSISTRDAMRIQGFPDDYVQPALPISKLRVILANAVPPGLARAVSASLRGGR